MINKNINLCKKFFSSKAGYNFLNFEIPIEANTVLSDLTPYFDKFIKDKKLQIAANNSLSLLKSLHSIFHIQQPSGFQTPDNNY